MNSNSHSQSFGFEATGSVAHSRISPLLPSDWVDVGSSSSRDTDDKQRQIPDFLWENAPMLKTKKYRDEVKAYSHLPNGTAILDSKWVLGRVLSQRPPKGSQEADSIADDPLLATCETHCFRGLDGFEGFCNMVKLFEDTSNDGVDDENIARQAKYADILLDDENQDFSGPLPKGPDNFWVLKDAMSNGAGGVWVVGPQNAQTFLAKETTPLYDGHAYVAQRYVWPPVLFDGRKCHVRVYGLLTADGKAYVHKRAFLHVANDIFSTTHGKKDGGDRGFEDSVHITNCCANSHDDSKFAGEILADFEQTTTTERDSQPVIPLAKFFPSIKACVAALAKGTFPFLQGGQANGGFEYMGMDFILSYNDDKQPVAYILEVNAPPSQDTATGLPHAENLHDDVIRDLLNMWVVPRVAPGTPSRPGGWRCVYKEEDVVPAAKENDGDSSLIVPSKATIINKIRWAMFEKKALRRVEAEAKEEKKDNKAVAKENTENGTQDTNNSIKLWTMECEKLVGFARSQFPYFSDTTTIATAVPRPWDEKHHCHNQVFFENAGGSQVAQLVIDAVTASLSFRHRAVVGDKTKSSARETLRRLLGAGHQDPVFVGPNASSLLSTLASKYVELGLLTSQDEIVVSTESHLANFDPWVKAAKDSRAVVKYWMPFANQTTAANTNTTSRRLQDLITTRTRIVAIPHASNVLGQVRDIKALATLVKARSQGHAHVVVDGVAAAPHWFSNVDESMVDWYVVSCHKLFSTHLGGLYGRRNGPVELFISAAGLPSDQGLLKQMETGTVNYEACAGVIGLGNYFKSLSQLGSEDTKVPDSSADRRITSGEDCAETGHRSGGFLPDAVIVSMDHVKQAYSCIRTVESCLVESLFRGLRRSGKVRIIEGDSQSLDCVARLPIACFVHASIGVQELGLFCEQRGYTCRVSTFLCTEQLSQDLGFDYSEGMLRVSLAHYNSIQEVEGLIRTLESYPGWF